MSEPIRETERYDLPSRAGETVADLRKEFLKLQKEFIGGRVSKLKKHEVAQRLAVLRGAMNLKADTPAAEPARTGPLPARDIPVTPVSLDESTTVIRPMPPGKRTIKPPTVTLEEPAAPAPMRKVVPKRKVVKKVVSKATAPPSTRKPQPEPSSRAGSYELSCSAREAEPASPPEVPAKLPSGVRRLDLIEHL